MIIQALLSRRSMVRTLVPPRSLAPAMSRKTVSLDILSSAGMESPAGVTILLRPSHCSVRWRVRAWEQSPLPWHPADAFSAASMKLGSFFAELKRRNVYKVAVGYAVVGWLLIQVATQVFPFFEIPNWAVRLVV